ncbi:hypothetical protein DFH09DRAFT_1098074 [Mycena vulgaris]|nr:hypothetical protein DFH09DRAFT_1098074 [Mycena vulgaris]
MYSDLNIRSRKVGYTNASQKAGDCRPWHMSANQVCPLESIIYYRQSQVNDPQVGGLTCWTTKYMGDILCKIYLCQQAVKIQILPWSRVLEDKSRGTPCARAHTIHQFHQISQNADSTWQSPALRAALCVRSPALRQVRLAHSLRSGCTEGIAAFQSSPRRSPKSAVGLKSSVRSRGGQHRRWGVNVRGIVSVFPSQTSSANRNLSTMMTYLGVH